MQHASTMEKVRELVADTCAVELEAVREEAHLLGYDLDSIRVVDLLIGIELELGVAISESDAELRNVVTVRDLAALVERRRRAA